MHTIHELEFDRQCPVNDALDHYEAKFESFDVVPVEDILRAIEALPKRAFQEVITRQLAEATGCRVTTVGTHSGVRTTCMA